MRKDVSVIVLTHDSYRLKHGSVESTIYSILSQVDVSIELIIIDNGSHDEDKIKLKNFVNRINDNRVRLVQLLTNNISMGRNEGIKLARTELVVFVDDDSILTRYDVLLKLIEKSREKEYGCFANRIWTNPTWYPSQKDKVDYKLIHRDELLYKFKKVDPSIRNKPNDRHLRRSYIGNFGFSRVKAIKAVGGWNENYDGYGAEDDDLLFRFFIAYGKPCLLSDINILHIFHEIGESDYSNLKKNRALLKDELRKQGVKEFHIGRLMYGEEDVIEYL